MNRNLIQLKREKPKLSIPIVFALLVALSLWFNKLENGEHTGVIVFSIITIIGLGISITFRSIMFFDKNQKQLLTRLYIFGLPVFTQSETLKDVRYLSIVPVIASSSITFMWSTRSFSEKSFSLNLILPKQSKKRFTTIETGNRNEMLKLGEIIAENLKKPLCEMHGKDANWILNN